MTKGDREGLVGAARPGNVMQAAGLRGGMPVLCAGVGTVWSAAAHCCNPWALCSPTACSDCTACEIQSFSFKNVLQISPHRLGNSFCHFTPWSLYSSPFKSLVALREENQKNRAWSVRDFGLTFSPCEMPISTACARSAVSCAAFGKAQLGAQGQALGMAAI